MKRDYTLPISIHAPIRGRRIYHRVYYRLINFNPRPHTGATQAQAQQQALAVISIHAPIRGRPRPRHSSRPLPLFQSTPPYGGDPRPPVRLKPLSNFNPRPYTGATDGRFRHHAFPSISIHAPIRGRHILLSMRKAEIIFQSTPPYGGDHNGTPSCHHRTNFNPRPHTGATTASPSAGT